MSGWRTDIHRAFSESAERFFEDHAEAPAHWRDQGHVDRAFWEEAGEAGLLGASLPERFGGSGGVRSLDAIVIEAHSGSGDTAWGFEVHNFVSHYIAAYGTERQRGRWLPDLISGKRVAAIAMTEPSGGSDLRSIGLTATRRGDEYLLNGSKSFISNGGQADLVCVVARTAEERSSSAISLIPVETEQARGFSRGKPLQKIGLAGQDTSELFFDNVAVPADNLLGEVEGRGLGQLMQQLPWERLSIAVASVALADLALRETLGYAHERRIFGRPLIAHQNSRFKLAEAKTRLEMLRAFVDKCLVALDAGTLGPAEASMAKLFGSESLCWITDECLQLHGGYGYCLDYPIARLFADARIQKIYGGTNEIMKEVIARSLETATG